MLCIPHSGYWIHDSLSLELGLSIPFIVRGFRTIWAEFRIPNSKAQDSRFYKEKIPGFRNLDCLTRGERLYKPNISQNLTSLIEAVTCVVDWTVKTTAYLKALIFSDSWPATIHTVNGGNHRTGVLKKEAKFCEHSNKNYWAVLSCGTIYYAVQSVSNFWVCGGNP